MEQERGSVAGVTGPMIGDTLELRQSWLEVCGDRRTDIDASLREAAREHLALKGYTQKDVEYVAGLERPIFDGTLRLSSPELEKLRLLCRLCEVRLKPQRISSHRPVVGKIIVAVKRALFPIVEVFMKDALRQQRDFNAAVVTLLTELTSRTTQK